MKQVYYELGMRYAEVFSTYGQYFALFQTIVERLF
jgi:hypothetical protein